MHWTVFILSCMCVMFQWRAYKKRVLGLALETTSKETVGRLWHLRGHFEGKRKDPGGKIPESSCLLDKNPTLQIFTFHINFPIHCRGVFLKCRKGSFNKNKTIKSIKIRLSHKTTNIYCKVYFNTTFFLFLHWIVDRLASHRSSHHQFYFTTF